jgi:hypothetical protein
LGGEDRAAPERAAWSAKRNSARRRDHEGETVRGAPLASAEMGDGRKLQRRRFEATLLTMVGDGDRRDGIHELSIRNARGA